MMRQRFFDRVVIVTGGGSGIGRATALAFAREGARVVIGELNVDSGESVGAEITRAGGQAVFVQTDATVEMQSAALVGRAVAEYGRLDHAFNNVGMSKPGDFETTTEADWDWTLATSLKAAWLGMKYQLPAIATAGGGSIVNTASMAGRRMTVAPPAYAAAKAGVIHLSLCAAHAYAHKRIRVNSVSPGLVMTPLIAGMYTPEQQAAIASATQLTTRAVQPEEPRACCFCVRTRRR